MTTISAARTSLALKIGLPLAAAGVLAAACSSGGTGGSGSASPAGYGSSATSPSAPSSSSSSTAQRSTSASTVDVHVSNGTSFITDSSGRALYLWVPDTSMKSACSGACAAAWPPLTTKGAPTAGPGATASDLSTITRSDGSKQVTYSGHPLYYYAGDSGPGQTNGEGSDGFGAPWYLVSPSGRQITSLN